MNNSITLYKIDCLYSGDVKPMFKNVAARTAYLERSEHRLVELNNPNIVIGARMQLTCVIPIDINEAFEYNFCVLKYNDKEYFADIYDAYMVSYGNTRLECKRNVLFEVIEPLSYFKDFEIERGNVKYNGGGKQIYFKADGLRNTLNYAYLPTPTGYPAKPTDSGYWTTGAEFMPFLVISEVGFKKTLGQTDALYGEVPLYNVWICPLIANLPWGYTDKIYSEFETRGKTYAQIFKELGDLSVGWDENEIKWTLRDMSPYVYKCRICYLPVTVIYYSPNAVTPRIPKIYIPAFSINKTEEDYYMQIKNTDLDDYTTDPTRIDYYFDRSLHSSYEINEDFDYSTYTLRIFGNDVVTIDTNEFCVNNKVSIKIEFAVAFTGTEYGIVYRIYSGQVGQIVEPTVEQRSLITGFVPIECDVTNVLDSEQNFLAQNAYYDQITKLNYEKTYAKGMLNAGSSIAQGAAQLGAASSSASMFKTAGGGTSVNGMSNIIRGVFQAAETVADAEYYKQERELLAKQEKAKPNEATQGSGGLSALMSSAYKLMFIKETPFENDIQTWLAHHKAYGSRCYKFCNTYTELLSLFDTSYGTLSFTIAASYSREKTLPNIYLSELQLLFSSYHRYIRYDENLNFSID